ncbi:hypothetical protein [Actinomadura madurae]|uniref:hypothetical protein n=1 Tax=Actinomadura madurae TaxID=1993 RepID=UPI0032B07B49
MAPWSSVICDMLFAVIATVAVSGGMMWGRIHSGIATWTPAKTASVIAMAGRVRRVRTPTVTPSAKAKAACPIGTMPCTLKFSGSTRANRSATALSSGSDHQFAARAVSPAAAMAARPTTPSFTASQRDRVTLWFQTSRCVPLSSSRVISGAPQKSPMRAGTIITIAIMAP